MLLLDHGTLATRRLAAAGDLAPLANSLATDLETVLARPLFIPLEKAKLTRIGGQCALDGTQLFFDPFTPHEHQCPRCHTRYRDPEHYRMWIMFYQQWLAERAVHTAALHALCDDIRHRQFAEDVLRRYAEAYTTYPNRDNVLGPSRVFFSTYLESIWLLQVCVAVDLLELKNASSPVGALVRERVIAPASSLIRGFDEGDSNRQVWNNAALLASARLLGDTAASDEVIHGQHGLLDLLGRTLLPDGTWYEGENYHQFAHRGLWYGVMMAELAGAIIPGALAARFQAAFATPFLTALPDFTFPARRDSRHKVSLRQWRYAESCELGLARGDDALLLGALSTLYGDDLTPGDTGRWRSAAESERNEPAVALTRADLGWRSLLCARPETPAVRATIARSVLLDGQGLAVFRRDRGTIYAALDYGHSGGGHGHPDRLNILLVDGMHRWLDDAGTGSYVDPTLHWYRSTLAHNAPMFGGQSQRRVSGTLIAEEDRGAAGWVRARVEGLAPESQVTRTLVVMPDYVVDTLEWRAAAGQWIDLPLHTDGELVGGTWIDADVEAVGSADGFVYVRSAQRATGVRVPLAITAREGNASLGAWVVSDAPLDLWRLLAPGPPGEADRHFIMLRSNTPRGSLSIVWSLRGSVASCVPSAGALIVHLADGARHSHRRMPEGWQVELHVAGARSSIDLGGVRAVPVRPVTERRGGVTPPRGSQSVLAIPVARGASEQVLAQWLDHARDDVNDLPRVRFELGEPHYQRSELAWTDAGAPAASVSLFAATSDLLIEFAVQKAEPTFAERRAWNALDNERADINSDGVQLYLVLPGSTGDASASTGSWLMVPDLDGSVRITRLDAAAASMPVDARWVLTDDGYTIRTRIRIGESAVRLGVQLQIEVMVNEISTDRERRRGQLVLSGGRDEFIYLKGDRHRGHWTTLRIAND